MTRRMIAAVSNPRTDVLGHCTGRQIKGKSRPQSEFDARAVFDACAEHGVAVEINCRPDRLDPPHELLDVADRGRLRLLDRHGRPRTRPAGLARGRLRAGRAARPGPRAGDHDVAAWRTSWRERTGDATRPMHGFLRFSG